MRKIMFLPLSSSSPTGYTGKYLNSKSINQYLPEITSGGFSYDSFLSTQKNLDDLYNDYTNFKINSNLFTKTAIIVSVIAILIAILVGSPIVYQWSMFFDRNTEITQIKQSIQKLEEDIIKDKQEKNKDINNCENSFIYHESYCPNTSCFNCN